MILNCPACDTEFVTWDVEITKPEGEEKNSDGAGNGDGNTAVVVKQSFTIGGTPLSASEADASENSSGGIDNNLTAVGGMLGRFYIWDNNKSTTTNTTANHHSASSSSNTSAEINVEHVSSIKGGNDDETKMKNKIWADVTKSPSRKSKEVRSSSAIMSEETFIPGLTDVDQTSSASGTKSGAGSSPTNRGFFKNLLEFRFSSGKDSHREGDEEQRRLKAQLVSQALSGSSDDL